MENNVEEKITDFIKYVYGLNDLKIRYVEDKMIVDSPSNGISFVYKNYGEKGWLYF